MGESFHEEVGSNIRRWREAKGLTQQELGRLAGTDYKYIGAVERGEQNPAAVGPGLDVRCPVRRCSRLPRRGQAR